MFEERKSPLDAVLVFIRLDQLLVSELLHVVVICGDQEGCLALAPGAFERLLIDHPPAPRSATPVRSGVCVFAGTSRPVLAWSWAMRRLSTAPSHAGHFLIC